MKELLEIYIYAYKQMPRIGRVFMIAMFIIGFLYLVLGLTALLKYVFT